MIRALVIAFIAACGGDAAPGVTPDSGPTADARLATLPTWMLEDVQPESMRFGQTYGLDVFSGSTVVVTLVEGF
jgi:hypothetical protein